MDVKSFHPILQKLVEKEFLVINAEAMLVLAAKIMDTHLCIKATSKLPVKAMKAVIGFIDTYFTKYPIANFKDCGHGVYELMFYCHKDGVREGVGITIYHDKFDIYKLEVVDGREVLHLTKNIYL